MSGTLQSVRRAVKHHEKDGDAHSADQIVNVPTAPITATTVQAALDELGVLGGGTSADVSAHLGDTDDAHDASAISVADAGNLLAAVNVETALTEVATDADAAAAAASAAQSTADAAVPKSLFDANTVLAADANDTPAAVTMVASTILARLAAGNIKAATPAELRTLLSLPPRSVDYQLFTASGTWTKPANAVRVTITACSGGAGGGSGANAVNGNLRGGGGGGGGGVFWTEMFAAADLSATATVTVGLGGAGGAGKNAAGNGFDGVNGGASSVVGIGGAVPTYITAPGGDKGLAGNVGIAGMGGGSVGFNAWTLGYYYNGTSGGAGGSTIGDSQTGQNGGPFPAGGGGGGGIDTSNVRGNGAAGGGAGGWTSLLADRSTGGAGGATNGAAGGVGKAGGSVAGTSTLQGGSGGGGSAARNTAASCLAGGVGGIPGGGGGGGGGITTSGAFTSGPGGAGARGFVLIITECQI